MLTLLLACAAPVDTASTASELDLGGPRLRLEGGRLSLYDPDGATILEGGVAEITLATATLRSDTLAGEVEPFTPNAALGAGEGLRWRGVDGDQALVWELALYESGRLTLRAGVENLGDAPLGQLSGRALLVERSEGGALHLGDPAGLRILENGAWGALDFTVEVLPGDAPTAEGFGDIAPGDYAGASVSNWNHAVAPPTGGPAWVAGALSFEASLPVLEIAYDPPLGEESEAFTRYAMGAAYLPQARPVAPGERAWTETFTVDPLAESAALGLEAYADAVAAWLELTPWHRREPGRRVPNGWNSWGGGGGSGGYGTNIDQALMLENLDFMAAELRDWGMTWFQLDDGYEPYYGDWTWREDRFPDGPAWLTREIRDRGLTPGLWMAPFTADPDSALVAEHPDWFAELTPLGQLFVQEHRVLDLTNPEVLDYLEDMGRQVREDWGFEWYKLDFGYYALFGDGFYDPEQTREQAWRQALARVRAGLGEDAFFLLVGTTGFNYDRVDAARTGLDTEPTWDPAPGDDNPLEQQGVKPGVRTAARRWYLQDRVWINHPDLLFFRDEDLNPDTPPLTASESWAHAAFIGLSGGVVKLGERLVEMEPEGVNVTRQLLPTVGRAATPLDLLERALPERWWLTLDGGLDGLEETWHLAGLFHWGSNTDLTTNPFTPIPDTDAPRTHMLELPEGRWLAYEFRTQAFLGEHEGSLEVEVPAHDARVVALRAVTDHPRFLGWNRQLSMGGAVLEEARWDGEALELAFVAAAGTERMPFTWEIALWAPEGFEVSEVEGLEGVLWTQEGPVTRLRFAPEETGPVRLRVRY